MNATAIHTAALPHRELRAAPHSLRPHIADTGVGPRGLAAMLDEVGNGLLLIDDGDEMVHANRAALAQLAGEHPLEIRNGRLRARAPADVEPLVAALEGARRGRRRLLMLGHGPWRTSVNIVPLSGCGLTMVSLGRRQVGDRLAIECFAQAHRLTGAETRVLHALCAGIEPVAIAGMMGKGLSTVRTQISHIREKTGARDITELMRQVAQLPPMAGLHAAADEPQPGGWVWAGGCALPT